MRSLSLCIIFFAACFPACFPASLLAEESSGVAVPEGILYQGRLKDDGLHVTGTRDLTVAIYAAESGGDALWTESHSGVPVVSGLFQIVLGSEEALPATVLAGGPRWLELQISGGPTLPRQALRSSPYARVAGVAAGVAAGSIERPALGSDLAGELDTLQDSVAALLARVGELEDATVPALDDRLAEVEATTESMEMVELDDQPTLRISGVNLQIVSGSGETYGDSNGRGNLIIGYNAHADPDAPADRSGSHNLVVGDEHTYPEDAKGAVVFGFDNTVADSGATAVGGEGNTASGSLSLVAGGSGNTASGLRSVVAGGNNNTADGWESQVAGGQGNIASGLHSLVAGGWSNTATGARSVVAGGQDNTASDNQSVVTGGQDNTASGLYSLVAGGWSNTASGVQSVAAGGENNAALDLRSVIAGGGSNIASGSHSVVAGGGGNTASGSQSVVAGGVSNIASGVQSVVAGGQGNTASGTRSFVVGGQDNAASGTGSVVAGGRNNSAEGSYSTFLGGGSFFSSATITDDYGTGARNFSSSSSATWPEP